MFLTFSAGAVSPGDVSVLILQVVDVGSKNMKNGYFLVLDTRAVSIYGILA